MYLRCLRLIALSLASALTFAADQQMDHLSSLKIIPAAPFKTLEEAPSSFAKNPETIAHQLPRQGPYQLPRFDDHYQESLYQPIAPLHVAPKIDVERLFIELTQCYPEVSTFALDIGLEAHYKNRHSFDTSQAAIGNYYIGIVARMPLYSSSEIYREREREYQRRTHTAQLIGQYLTALAQRNHAVRTLGLYSSLEARAQVRVLQGVIGITEQVQYLEKVATAQQRRLSQEALLTQYQLQMAAMCHRDKVPALNAFLQKISYLKE